MESSWKNKKTADGFFPSAVLVGISVV